MSDSDPSNTRIPFMPFYISDFRGHAEVRMMDFYERALYIELLMSCWESSDDSIPDDRMRLAKMTGLTQEEFNKLWPFIRDRFVNATEGRLTHPRIAREKTRVRTRARVGKENALKRWHKNAGDE